MSTIARILRLLGDETRLRILILVSHTPLNVSEITNILGLAQSGVSRHLSQLKEMKLLQENKEGTWTYYQLAEKKYLESNLHLLWDYLQQQLSSMKDPYSDQVRLHEILQQRKIDLSTLNERLIEPGQSWFAWSCLLGILLGKDGISISRNKRKKFRLEIADLGCGDGTLTAEMARFGTSVIGVDNNPKILASARQRMERLGLKNVKLISEDIKKLSLASNSIDIVFFSQSLHHLENPEGSIKEAARLLRNGGQLMIMELATHNERWVLDKLGHKYLGFEKNTLESFIKSAGIQILFSEKLPFKHRDLFQIILCTGKKS